jgi:hypothetical protein
MLAVARRVLNEMPNESVTDVAAEAAASVGGASPPTRIRR